MTHTNKDIIESFISAYNSGEDEKLLSLCTDDIMVTHHNRDVVINGKEAFREILTTFKTIIPTKAFTNRRAFFVDGNNVIVEHTWGGKVLEEVPGFAKKGESLQLDLCTRYSLKDGLISEYHDYG
jgi:steroid delta-isomerase-like uncharacterized protein